MAQHPFQVQSHLIRLAGFPEIAQRIPANRRQTILGQLSGHGTIKQRPATIAGEHHRQLPAFGTSAHRHLGQRDAADAGIGLHLLDDARVQPLKQRRKLRLQVGQTVGTGHFAQPCQTGATHELCRRTGIAGWPVLEYKPGGRQTAHRFEQHTVIVRQRTGFQRRDTGTQRLAQRQFRAEIHRNPGMKAFRRSLGQRCIAQRRTGANPKHNRRQMDRRRIALFHEPVELLEGGRQVNTGRVGAVEQVEIAVQVDAGYHIVVISNLPRHTGQRSVPAVVAGQGQHHTLGFPAGTLDAQRAKVGRVQGFRDRISGGGSSQQGRGQTGEEKTHAHENILLTFCIALFIFQWHP